MSVCVCMCVCEREIERGRQEGRDRDLKHCTWFVYTNNGKKIQFVLWPFHFFPPKCLRALGDGLEERQHGQQCNTTARAYAQWRTQGITLWRQLTLLAVCFGKNLTFCSEWKNQVFGNCVSKNKFSHLFFSLQMSRRRQSAERIFRIGIRI